jgi:sn-glycerol 3-phosphate transport system substrate-binding protein
LHLDPDDPRTHRLRPARRGGVVLPLALVLALVAAACGGGSDDSGDDGGDGGDDGGDDAAVELPECPIDALEGVEGPVEVVLWHFLGAQTATALEDLAAEFNESQDQIEVRVEEQGTNNDELWEKYRAGIGTGDLPAIAVTDDTVTVEMIDSGTVLPAQSCIDAEQLDTSSLLESGSSYYTLDGVLYPASINLSAPLLYFNENHFRRAGLDIADPPQTLDELRATAQAIKDAGVVEQPLVLKVGPPLLEMWLTGVGQPFVNNENGRGTGETSEAAFDTPQTVELYQWILDMRDDGLLNVIPDTPGQVNHYLAMAQGTGSMVIETSTAATSVEAFLGGDLGAEDIGDDVEVDPEDIDLDALAIGAAPVPGIEEPGRLSMGGGAWYMTNTGEPEVQAAAWEFMKFFNSVPSQVTWNLVGSYLPYNTDALDDPELQARWTDTLSGRWLAMAYEELETGVDPDFPGPLMGPYSEFRESLRGSVEGMIFEDTPPDEAVASAADETTEALQRYLDENF